MKRRVAGEMVWLVLGGAIAGAVSVGARATLRKRMGGAAVGAVAGAAAAFVGARIAGPRRVPPHGPVTQALVSVSPADTVIGPPGANVEQRLDEAIQETYPASDPISVHIE